MAVPGSGPNETLEFDGDLAMFDTKGIQRVHIDVYLFHKFRDGHPFISIYGDVKDRPTMLESHDAGPLQLMVKPW